MRAKYREKTEIFDAVKFTGANEEEVVDFLTANGRYSKEDIYSNFLDDDVSILVQNNSDYFIGIYPDMYVYIIGGTLKCDYGEDFFNEYERVGGSNEA